jgi:hypothetical protein
MSIKVLDHRFRGDDELSAFLGQLPELATGSFTPIDLPE